MKNKTLNQPQLDAFKNSPLKWWERIPLIGFSRHSRLSAAFSRDISKQLLARGPIDDTVWSDYTIPNELKNRIDNLLREYHWEKLAKFHPEDNMGLLLCWPYGDPYELAEINLYIKEHLKRPLPQELIQKIPQLTYAEFLLELSQLKPFWCVIMTDSLPEDFIDGVVLSDGFTEDLPEEIPPGMLTYALLCRTVAASEDKAHAKISENLQHLTITLSQPITTLPDDNMRFCRCEQKTVSDMSPGDFSLRMVFVGFLKDNPTAQKQTLKFIQQAITKKKYQFWK
ncbi:MAG: hypothetical protein GY869_18190 [Planctomycetes bacterium]|nr:hypothetical protein [Planctomycetota bacterium]